MIIEKYPLQWPVGYKRTQRRERSKFKQTMDAAQRQLHDEVGRLGGRDLIVSSNIPIRQDGRMYSAYMDRQIPDPGVAVYFRYKGKDVVMCCDQYQAVWENIYALAKGIEALRGLERWGVSEFLERAFTGFTALPPAATNSPKLFWWIVLGYQQRPGTAAWDWAGVEASYKSLAKKRHPDSGGSTEAFQELVQAFAEAKVYYGK